jgi:hypothetical protein
MAIISGGQTLSTTNLTDLLDGGASTLHSHAASAAFPTQSVSYVFSDGLDNMLTFHLQGTGAKSYVTNGLLLRPGSTAGSHARCYLEAAYATLFKRKPTFRCSWRLYYDLGDDFIIFLGIGQQNSIISGAWVPADDHLGFKTVRIDDGDINLYATQADGTTEAASGVLTTLNRGQDIDVAFKVITEGGSGNGKVTSCDYYWSINRTNWNTTATNLTANGARLDEGSSLLVGITNEGEPHTTELLVVVVELGG